MAPRSPRSIVNCSTGYFANSPIVNIPRLLSLADVDLPHVNKSSTGKGHILLSISFENRVCTLFGFSKSLAIFAHNLLEATPTLTVNPSSL